MKKRDRKEYLKQYYLKNRDKALELRKEYYQEHKEYCIEYAREYRKANREILLIKRSFYYRANKDSCLKSSKRHRLENKGKYKLYSRAYKLRKVNRTPIWTTPKDKQVMQAYYDLSIRLSNCLNIPFEVDHIIPLRGQVVSGLHVPSNLTVITKSENARKSNKYNIKI